MNLLRPALRRSIRWLLRGLLLLVVLALLVLLAYVWRASPQHSGTLQAAGLGSATRIERDAHGIPSIEAGNGEDLAYALGFAHAQDRGWQLEVQRRIGAGRLSEALGPGALETDRFLRMLGVYRAAQAQWAWSATQTDPVTQEARRVAQAYANGVNAGWRSQARPPEMLLLGLEFETFTPVDSLAWALMMAWDLGMNWSSELQRLRILIQSPDPLLQRMQALQALVPPYPGEAYPALLDAAALYASLGLGQSTNKPLQTAQMAKTAQSAWPAGDADNGSNNWAVAGTRSATGQPLLANDPHLKLQSPSLWYLVRLQQPGLKLAGASIPGLPQLVLGQNEHLAWAYTNTAPDTQDLYLEELRDGPDGRTEARTPEGWRVLQERIERIAIKGGGEERLQVRSTRHGPLLSDIGVGRELLTSSSSGRRFGLALRWIAQDAAQDPFGANLLQTRAKSLYDYREAMRRWHSPMQSMLVAETARPGLPQGAIHLIAPGRVPRRGPAHDLHGLLPAPGWEARYDWQGERPFDSLPQLSQPAGGVLATANQRITAPGAPEPLTHDWALPWRQLRIEQQLATQAQHSLDSLAALQADQQSLAAAPLQPWFRAARSSHPLAAALQAEQARFDGRMAAADAAPALFTAWLRHFTEQVLADELGSAAAQALLPQRSFRDAIERLPQQPQLAARWCDTRDTPAVESCAQQADAALSAALEELQQRLGSDPARWRWGQLHLSKAEHRPFSRVAPLRWLFELQVERGGDAHTVDAARALQRPDWSGQRYSNDHGPGLRALYDLADRQQSRAIISSGQSGLPWSTQYRDQLKPWAKVQYLPLWTPQGKTERLTLQPASK